MIIIVRGLLGYTAVFVSFGARFLPYRIVYCIVYVHVYYL